MKGFPKHLNTKQDYIYIKDNFPKEEWQPVWKSLLENTKNWFCTGTLTDKNTGKTDSTHKIVESASREGEEEKVVYYQYELQTDKSCDLLRLGFTEEEVKSAIKS